ncbi:MAG: PAS domain-containing protein, partial [Muribaculaceae bacterium]|nr:PAS domain-containing protein [Muribaculaceae bacterium]
MSSRFIYIILFAATLAVTVMAAVWLPADFHPAVIVAGVVLLALEVWLYVALVRPVRTLANGIGLIRAQDFSSRLARVGQIDADRLVETFNRMMDVLKSERLRLNERNNFLQLLIDASPAAIVVGDFDGRVTDCNPAAVALFGALPPGATLASLPGDLGAACASLPRGASAMVRLSNTEIYRCSSLSFMESGFSRPFLLVESVTEEVRRAERQAGHRIVRAMAHEVNNTIGGVGTILEI